MALKKCRECGKEVSSGAKTCPHCGVSRPVKTNSIWSWLLAIVVGVIIYQAIVGPSSSSYSSDSGSATSTQASQEPSGNSPPTSPSKSEPPPKPSWRNFVSEDEMDGSQSAYAVSPEAHPSRPMGFPYQDVTGRMAFGCDANDEWMYFKFSTAPNLNETETKDGYNLLNTRIRWGSTVKGTTLTQDWGSKFMHFRDYAGAISHALSDTTVMLELPWHGEGTVHFTFSLNGSSDAISDARKKCAAF